MANEMVTVTGLEEVQALLQNAPKVVVATGYLRGLQAGAEVIQQELYIRTPECDEGERNDDDPHLNESMVVDIALDSNFRGGVAEVGFGKMGWKANLVEYGHQMVGHKPAKKVLGTVAAHPFMRPAAAAAADRAIEAFANELESVLRGALTDGSV